MAVVALAFAIGLAVDLFILPRHPPANPLPDVAMEIQRLRDGLNGPRYTHPSGLFSIVAPVGWKITPETSPKMNSVTFNSPGAVTLTVMATPVPYNDLPSLFADIQSRESSYGMRTKAEAFYFQGRSAAIREAPLAGTRLIVIDFVENGVAHNLAIEAPTESVEQYRAVLLEWLNTYRPGASRPVDR